jgi:photosystem II stability/assembly factor-like uncharacterized protein
MKMREGLIVLVGGLLLAACGGGSSSGAPLAVNNLQADRSQTSLGVPVTFTVQCSAASGAPLSYRWHYGDETDPNAVTDTTTVPTAIHAYRVAPHVPLLSSYDTYQYYVTCVDSTQPSVSAKASPRSIQVLRIDLALSNQLCSSGAPGRGWCWQSPLPTGEGLSAVAAVSSQVAWAVGDFGTVLKSVDGGTTWLPLYVGGVATSLPVLKGVGASDAENAWVVGVDGSFWVTHDGGTTWLLGKPSAPLPLISLVTTDAAHAFGVSGSGTVFATANAGVSWSSLAVPGLASGSQLLAIGALDAQNVFVAGSGTQAFEIETADGGAHWTAPLMLADGFAFGINPETVGVTRGSRCGNSDGAATEDSVWLAGWGNVTGGVVSVAYSWARGSGSAGAQHHGGDVLNAFDGRTAWMYDVSSGGFFVTGDDLQSVTAAVNPFPREGNLHAFDTADCTTGWVVGSGGEIARTTDGAHTWVPQSSPNAFVPTFHGGAARSTTDAVALALSYDSQSGLPIYSVFATSDGLTWQVQHSDTVDYVNGSYAPFITTDAAGDIVCGSIDYLAIYANGAWSPNLGTAAESQPNAHDVSFVAGSISGRTAWIIEAQHGQVILDDLSVNAPYASLPKTTIPGSYSPSAIAAVDPTHAVLVGANGIQLVSYSGGSWQWTSAASGMPTTAISLGGNGGAATSGWAVGLGTVLRTTDGGKTWTPQSWPSAQVFDTALTSVSTIDGTEGWIGGHQVMLHTTDGGAHWTMTDMTVFYAAAVAAGPYAAWAIGPGSFIRKTLTGGVVPPAH